MWLKRVLVGVFCILLMTLKKETKGQTFVGLNRRYLRIIYINENRIHNTIYENGAKML